jgi:hypothetical protein
MVNLPALQAQRQHYDSNLQQYVKEHPGEWVLIEGGTSSELKVSFFKTRAEYLRTVDKYKGMYGPTYHAEQIPVRTHRFNKDNRTLEFRTDEHVKVCPNDKLTKLVTDGAILSVPDDKGSRKYVEWAICLDCGYKVERKPTAEVIGRVKKRQDKMVFR